MSCRLVSASTGVVSGGDLGHACRGSASAVQYSSSSIGDDPLVVVVMTTKTTVVVVVVVVVLMRCN